MNKFLDTYPVQVFKINKALMTGYIDNLSGHYEREILGRDNVMAHEEKVNRDGKSTTLKRKMQDTFPVCPAIYENKYLRKKSTPIIVD